MTMMNYRFDAMSEAPAVPQVIQAVNPSLPMPELVTYYELEKERKIYLEGDVDNGVLNLQRLILRWNMEDAGKPVEERKPIRLFIFSPGGGVEYMWSLIDTIQVSETPVHTINMGMAASAAGLIFLSGHKRFMLPRSRVMIHEGSASMAGDAVKVLDASESYKKMMKQMREYILERTNIPVATLNKQKSHDWELDAKYCLEHGACEEIVEKLGDLL